MQLLVRIFSGKTVVLDVKEDYTVLELKEMIYDREMIPIHLQRLKFNTKYLENSVYLKDYNIVQESFLQLV